MERPAGAGGGGASRRPGEPRQGDGRAGLRPLVRLGAVPLARGVRAPGRAEAGSADHPVRLLDGLHRSGRGRLRPSMGTGTAEARRPDGRGGHRRAAAPAECRAVARRSPRRFRRRRLASSRGGADRPGIEAELLRLDLPRGRRRRDQHERADRGSDRGPAGAHGPRRRLPGDPGGDAALPLPAGRGVRASACGADDGRTRGSAELFASRRDRSGAQ